MLAPAAAHRLPANRKYKKKIPRKKGETENRCQKIWEKAEKEKKCARKYEKMEKEKKRCQAWARRDEGSLLETATLRSPFSIWQKWCSLLTRSDDDNSFETYIWESLSVCSKAIKTGFQLVWDLSPCPNRQQSQMKKGHCFSKNHQSFV